MPHPAAKHDATYSAARSAAAAEAAEWHPKRIRHGLARYLDTLSDATRARDLSTAHHAAGTIDALTDLLLPPSLPLALTITSIGFQFRRHSASSPWESWMLRPEERCSARHHHDQFRDHLAERRCAALTAIAPRLDWSALPPLLTPPQPQSSRHD